MYENRKYYPDEYLKRAISELNRDIAAHKKDIEEMEKQLEARRGR